MNRTNELELLKGQLNDLLNEDQPKELSVDILRRIKDIIYLLDRSLYEVARESNENVRKIIRPIYEFLRSFHTQLKNAVNDPDHYQIEIPEEPDLPDMSDFDDKDKSLMKDIVQTIIDTLPSLVDLVTSLQNANYPYEREVKIVVNTINDFCNVLVHGKK